jgi:uncharacterized protein (DUF983 family)
MYTLIKNNTAMPEVSTLNAAIHAKCPKCHRGDMFANKMYAFSSQKMNETCPHCGFKFEIELGYFYVAMFVSYAFNVAQMVTVAISTYLLTGSNNPWLYLAILFTIAFLLAPFNFRYSRVVLLYWLTPGVHYEPHRAKEDYKKFVP